MPTDPANEPATAARRRDRAVDDESWIKAFLHHAAHGSLATVHDGQPFINTNLFVYDEAERAIFLHTARLGRTRSNVDSGEGEGVRACFSVSEIGRLLPADEALEFSVEYAGVTVFGSVSVVDDPEKAERALQQLLDKYAPHLRPGRDYRPITAGELNRTAVYRFDIEEWSGKKKEVEEGFPGAFVYRGGKGT